MVPTLVPLPKRLVSMKVLFFVFVCICMFIPLGSYLHDIQNLPTKFIAGDQNDIIGTWHDTAVDDFFELRMNWTSSSLGRILFHQDGIPIYNPNANRTFVILVWRYWNWLKSRHVFNFGKPGYEEQESKILEGCSVNNCIFSGNESLIDTADAVLVHLQRGLVPEVENRNRNQRWIFLNDESPINAFSLAKVKPNLTSLYNVFNWSMTYRFDADVPVPYGRTLALQHPLVPEFKPTHIAKFIPNWQRKRQDKVAAVLMSNCGVKARNEFLGKLRKYVDVDVFGACSDKEEFKNSCPGHFRADCDPVAEYLFYLVLENTSCMQYLTEKVFYHAYSKGAVPIIFGPRIDDIETLLPPNSYLYANEETDIELLANNINKLAKNQDLLLGMHTWRNQFEVVNEHGYFGTKSYHLCRVCEALNYNSEEEKIYNKELLDYFLDPSKVCNL